MDNGQKVLRKDKIEEIIVEPIFGDSISSTKDNYAILSPQDFESMTQEELKEWYKANKNK